ncbi:MAG TPA: PLDc N-terminal domain-containing protein [Acidimicrobiia bacterium]|nr:PLDc N-terminal domain-containing protein [Acidimicrobiia bacterium]
MLGRSGPYCLAKEVGAVIFGDGVVALSLLVLWIFCILDVISTEDVLCRNLPKYFWLLIVIILPDIGSIAWLLLGRPVGAGFRLGSQVGVYRPQKRVIGPEDSPDFLASMERKRLESWEQELKRREEELRRKQDEGDSPN